MQAKTTNSLAFLLMAATLAAGLPAGAAELWEVFAPAAEAPAPELATIFADEKETVGKELPASEAVEPDVAEPEAAAGPSIEAKQATEDRLAALMLASEPETITATAFASDLGASPSFITRALSVEEASAPAREASPSVKQASGDKELWALFAQATQAKPEASNLPVAVEASPISAAAAEAGSQAEPALSLVEVLLGSSEEKLRVAQAVEEVLPPAFPSPLEFPQASESASPLPDEEVTALDRSIFSLTLDAAVRPELSEGIANLDDERAIKDLATGKFGSWDAPQYEASLVAPRFVGNEVRWAAPAFYSRPLYFEQPNLERYGHHVAFCRHDNLTQSAISAAHFFVTVPALPYALGANAPDECSYVLGAYRPGSCNPHQIVKPRASLKGLVFEGVAATGLVFLVP